MQFTVFGHYANLVSRTKFETPAVNASTLKEVFLKYGRSARHVFKLARVPSDRDNWENMMQANLRRIPDLGTFQDLLQDNGIDIISPAMVKMSSQLVSIYPSATRSLLITLVSQHIADHLFDAVLKDNNAKFCEYFNLFWAISEGHPTAGWLWESHVRHELSKGPKQKIPLIRLPTTNAHTSSGQLSMDLPFPKVKTFGNCEDLANGLVRIAPILQDGSRLLFLPGAKNQATYDAFAIPGLQMANATIAPDHDLSPKGFDFVLDAAIRAETLANETEPRKFSSIAKDFPHAKMHFNHYIKVHELNSINARSMLLLAARGAGVLCANTQEAIDGANVFLCNGTELSLSSLGLVLWQVKNDSRFGESAEQHLFDGIDPYKLRILAEGEPAIPIIKIVFALASKTASLVVKRHEPSAAYNACVYEIWCAGIIKENGNRY
jgi:hypothetical protein